MSGGGGRAKAAATTNMEETRGLDLGLQHRFEVGLVDGANLALIINGSAVCAPLDRDLVGVVSYNGSHLGVQPMSNASGFLLQNSTNSENSGDKLHQTESSGTEVHCIQNIWTVLQKHETAGFAESRKLRDNLLNAENFGTTLQNLENFGT
ncbi:hypothetical protein Adt_29323 [Abeliophyllum distichum]|uniref:Uncharacterized protein n=1 Tax=Abeliophyllum distichum TaxID=126358 RepID=A0ABD1R940_9LAMI